MIVLFCFQFVPTPWILKKKKKNQSIQLKNEDICKNSWQKDLCFYWLWNRLILMLLNDLQMRTAARILAISALALKSSGQIQTHLVGLVITGFFFFFLWQSAEDQSTAVTGWGKKPLCRNSILLSIPSLESISLIFSINTSAENIIWFISQLVFQISTKFTTVLAVNLLLKSVTKKEIPNLCRPGPSGFTAFFLFFTQ